MRVELGANSEGTPGKPLVTRAPSTLQAFVAALGEDLETTVTATKADYPTGASTSSVPHLVVKLGELKSTGTDDLDGDGSSDAALRLQVAEGAPALTSVTGQGLDLDLRWSSTVRLDLAVPLDPGTDPNDVLVLDSTGVSALEVRTDDDGLAFTGSYGGLGLEVGGRATTTGTHQDLTGSHSGAASARTLTSAHDLTAAGLASGVTLTNTTDDGASCTVESVTASTATCAADLSDGATWDQDDRWSASPGPGLHAPGAGFDDAGLELGTESVRNTTTGASCVVTAATKDRLTCGGADAVTWRAGDAYAFGGAGSFRVALTYSLQVAADARLTPAAGGQGFLEQLEGATGALDGGFTCGKDGVKAAACARLALQTSADDVVPPTVTPLGTLTYVLGTGLETSGTVPETLTKAQQGGEPLDFELLDLGLPFLPRLVEGYLDGTVTGTSAGLVGTDLSAGARVVDGLNEVTSALSGFGDGLQAASSFGDLRTGISDRVVGSLGRAVGVSRLDAPTITLTCGADECDEAKHVGVGSVPTCACRSRSGTT